MAKLISIIIPYHSEPNAQIFRAVSSINSQIGIDFNQIEVVLVGDGVPQLPKNMFEYLDNIKPRVVATAESHGAGVARQKGIELTSGKYIMFVDADDVLYNVVALRDLIDALQTKGDHQMIIGQFWGQSWDGNKFTYSLYANDGNAAYGKLFNRAYIEQIQLKWRDDLRIFEDTYFVNLAVILAKDLINVEVPVYMWLWNGNSITRKDMYGFNCQLHTWALANRHILAKLREQHSPRLAPTFNSHLADLFLRAKQYPPVDPDAYRKEQTKLLVESRGMWTKANQAEVKRIAETMVTPDGRFPNQNMDGFANFLQQQDKMLYAAFLAERTQQRSSQPVV